MSNLSMKKMLYLATLCFFVANVKAMEDKSEALVESCLHNQTLSVLETIPEEKIDDDNLQDDEEPIDVIDNKIKSEKNWKTLKDKGLETKNDEVSEYTSNINEFFVKYPNPQYLTIMECDGVTQSIYLAQLEKALVNLYYEKYKNLGLINNTNKWVGISYGCTLAGANVGTLTNSEDIEQFNLSIDDIITHLKHDRINQNNCCTKFTNCLFNCCLCCFKCCAKSSDIDIIRESQFDQATSSALQLYIKNYFPYEVSSHLIFLQSGKDRRRIDPDYQSSYVATIEAVNKTAKKNKRNVIRKNIGFITDTVADVADKTDVPIVGNIAKVTGKVITGNVEFKSIDNSNNVTAYQEMSGEILDIGTFKIIFNIDNVDAPDLSCDFRIEYKKEAKKLKYKLTVNIPTKAYCDMQHNFEEGYQKILDYLNEKRVKHYLEPMFKFINGMRSFETKNKH